jgi:hypothetical protein
VTGNPPTDRCVQAVQGHLRRSKQSAYHISIRFSKTEVVSRRLATYLWSNTSSTSIDMAKYPKVTAFYADMNAGGQGTWMGKLAGVPYEISSRITYGKYREKQTRSAGGFL